MNEATNYEAALQQAEAELAAHEQRGQALRNAVESLKALLALEPAKAAAPKAKRAPAKRKPGRPKKKKVVKIRKRRKSAGAGHPPVASDAYAGMGPTAAYRKFIAEFGLDTYTVPQIRDALVAGGVESKTQTSLLTGLHSVRRRDRIKAEAEAAAKAAAEASAEASSDA